MTTQTPKERAWDLIHSNEPLAYDDGAIMCDDLAEAIAKLYELLDANAARLEQLEQSLDSVHSGYILQLNKQKQLLEKAGVVR